MVPIGSASSLNLCAVSFHSVRMKEINRIIGIHRSQILMLAAGQAVQFLGVEARGKQNSTGYRVGRHET